MTLAHHKNVYHPLIEETSVLLIWIAFLQATLDIVLDDAEIAPHGCSKHLPGWIANSLLTIQRAGTNLCTSSVRSLFSYLPTKNANCFLQGALHACASNFY